MKIRSNFISCSLALLQSSVILLSCQNTYGKVEKNLNSVLSEYAIDGGLDDSVALFHFSVDLDGDGREEVLVTDETSENGKAGNIWRVYMSRLDGFSELDGYMELRLDTIAIGTPGGADTTAIASYHPKSAEAGRLHGYLLSGGAIQEIDWGEIRQGQPLEDTYENLFENSASVSVDSIEVRDVKVIHAETLKLVSAELNASDKSKGKIDSPPPRFQPTSVRRSETINADPSNRSATGQKLRNQFGSNDDFVLSKTNMVQGESIKLNGLFIIVTALGGLVLGFLFFRLRRS